MLNGSGRFFYHGLHRLSKDFADKNYDIGMIQTAQAVFFYHGLHRLSKDFADF